MYKVLILLSLALFSHGETIKLSCAGPFAEHLNRFDLKSEIQVEDSEFRGAEMILTVTERGLDSEAEDVIVPNVSGKVELFENSIADGPMLHIYVNDRDRNIQAHINIGFPRPLSSTFQMEGITYRSTCEKSL